MERNAPSPIKWARWGALSHGIARLWPPRPPAVLILSLPRSGSSWVGETLGNASNALYLREPITQSDHSFYDRGTVFPLDPPLLERRYRELADKAFMGWPDFPPLIVRFPDQWHLRSRSSRHIVIKEVNPLATEWYVQRYQPRLIFLIRHPAAVAASLQSQGWLSGDSDAWEEKGKWQAHALKSALDTLKTYPAHKIVHYEELCADPVSSFEGLFDFAGLLWDRRIRSFVVQKSQQHDAQDRWQTTRNSREMIDKWRKNVSPAQLAALRRGFQQFNLPFYQRDTAW